MSQKIKINYYDRFQCIADKCSLTCCQEWRIAVDEDTKKKWKGQKISVPQGEEVSELLIDTCLKAEDSGSIIKLNHDKKCPFLNDKKLCKLVIQLGEEYLSDTCTTSPREIHEFEDRTEYALASCCPVVVDLMKEEAPKLEAAEKGKIASVLYEVREVMHQIMSKDEYTLPQRMLMIFYVLLDSLEQKKLTKEKLKTLTEEKELHVMAKTIGKMTFSKIDSILESNELFLDVVENYRKQGLYVNFLESIAKRAEVLEADYDETVLIEKYESFQSEIQAYHSLIKHYLMSEIIGNSLTPDSDLKDMVIAYEWISLEYIVLRQALFLKWLEEETGVLPYDTVRDYICVIARVTGYDASDIYEYLENSFEEVIWQWGYMAMVLGDESL